ncbi:MAG: FliM/FliN family flagellar motor switch protein [Deltaproteobacteria bacterium]|nr:FliM/FliN family flagellar motor switch protein [Deltaproteobacteria bacterium]
MATVRPYRFETLERWTRDQLAVFKTLHAYLPSSPFGPGFKEELRGALQKYVNCDLDVWLDSMAPMSGAKLMTALQNPTLIAVLGMPPEEHKVFLEFDLALASLAVDRALGGKGSDNEGQTPLTEIEQGVFAFLLLRALALLKGEWGDESPVGIKLEALRSTPEAIAELIVPKQTYFNVAFKFLFDLNVGFARMFFPAAMMGSRLLPGASEEGAAAERRRQYMRSCWQRLSGVRINMVIEGGTAELSSGDLANLDAGDIILIENSNLSLAGGQLAGPALARVGSGTHGQVNGQIETAEDGRLQFTIEEIVQIAEPETVDDGAVATGYETDSDDDAEAEENDDLPGRARGDMASRRRVTTAHGAAPADDDSDDLRDGTEHDEDEDEQVEDDGEGEVSDEEGAYEEGAAEEEGEPDNMAETEGLLHDIAVPLVVEIGRVKMTASDVVNLRIGQVFDLRRSPHDPVDLVVQNRLIGKGELVEVDGNLGVRLLNLAK